MYRVTGYCRTKNNNEFRHKHTVTRKLLVQFIGKSQ